MKHRVLDAMSEALDLVRQSDLAKATAVIRKALSEGEARSDTGVREARPQRPAARVVAPSARRSLGETLRALRTGPLFPPAAPVTPQAEPPNEFDPRFLRRTMSTRQGRSATASMFRRITSGGSSRSCSCFTAARKIRKISRSAPR